MRPCLWPMHRLPPQPLQKLGNSHYARGIDA
ncbi:hypothetical protein [Microviridae sp.]|nr:hypothetical protein [Microviridae sp.]